MGVNLCFIARVPTACSRRVDPITSDSQETMTPREPAKQILAGSRSARRPSAPSTAGLWFPRHFRRRVPGDDAQELPERSSVIWARSREVQGDPCSGDWAAVAAGAAYATSSSTGGSRRKGGARRPARMRRRSSTRTSRHPQHQGANDEVLRASASTRSWRRRRRSGPRRASTSGARRSLV